MTEAPAVSLLTLLAEATIDVTVTSTASRDELVAWVNGPDCDRLEFAKSIERGDPAPREVGKIGEHAVFLRHRATTIRDVQNGIQSA